MDPCFMTKHKPNIHLDIIGPIEKSEDVLIPGKVNEVCKQWLVHEDGALAYKLQNEEIQSHYGGNKHRNAIVRQDVPRAKEEQEKELLEARKLEEAKFYKLQRQEQQDADLALRIQEELMLQDKKMLETIQNADLELATRLQLEEKDKKEKLVGNTRSSLHLIPHDDLHDLSDFCIQPDPGMDPESVEKLREAQDAELALLLQEQETKRRGGVMDQDQLLALEAQDRELAKLLYEQEKLKLKRAKERAKQKALLKKQQKSLEGNSSIHSDDVASSSGSSDTSTLNEYTKDKYRSDVVNGSCSGESMESNSSVKYLNVAMAIDPTYKKKSKEEIPKEIVKQEAESNLLQEILDDSPIPPYMPIQGQRRLSTLEEKKRKKKESREGCKQQ